MDMLIAGAGIGGLTAALSLHAAGFEKVRVVEAAPVILPLGAGVNLLPNAVRELAALGLYERIAEQAAPIEELGYYNQWGQPIWQEPRGRAAGYRMPQLAVHRGALHSVLVEAVIERIGPDAILTDARFIGFTGVRGFTGFDEFAAGRVRAQVAHRNSGRADSEIAADVLVGADGIRSAVRAALYPQEGAPPHNGVVVWRATTRTRPFLGGRAMAVMGDGQWKAVVYPLAAEPDGDGLVPVNWAVSRTTDAGDPAAREYANRPVPRERFRPHFADWRCGDLALSEVLAGEDPVMEFPMIDRDPLPRWSFGRSTLLGDAAHAMAPMGSNATSQAVIDARALAHALASYADPVAALRAYDRERRPAMNRLQVLNRAKGPEVVIDMASTRAPGGFTRIDEFVPEAVLAEVSRSYAYASHADLGAANGPSPYEAPAHPVR
ncbi:flavin-dependent oxidoreductase [Streptomyces venezuelae]|uniref:Flavin-dependent oxidoreductase n=1 Tax=Streptomyces venezuelae TaxID=54571 RepID=A0A5P2D2D3_STRVZ|nr:FAD-dependent monooxygenase [Streptomyces venezuelae]QES47501.1 flavin-dependent oxidoreductase [Streptomyces venezuelae]